MSAPVIDEVAAFRRELAFGRRDWRCLALPWGADLRGVRLSGCDLSGASLRRVRLDDAVLDGCTLVEADLRRASLRGAVLVRADLRGARLRGADLRDADLTGADLCRAETVCADLRGATLEGAAVSFNCAAYAGVALDGATVRQLYSLLLLTRPDDPEVARALETLRSALSVPLEPAIVIEPDDEPDHRRPASASATADVSPEQRAASAEVSHG